MRLIRSTKAAKIFGIHPDTLRKWDRLGILKPDFTTPAGQRLYSEQRLLEIVRAGRLPSTADKDEEPRATA